MVGWRNGRDKFKPSIAHFEENPLDGGQLSSTSTFFLIFFACATHVAQLFHLYKTWKGKIQGSSNVTLNGETRFDSSKILSLKSNSSACIAVHAKLYPNPIDDLNLLDFHGPSSFALSFSPPPLLRNNNVQDSNNKNRFYPFLKLSNKCRNSRSHCLQYLLIPFSPFS